MTELGPIHQTLRQVRRRLRRQRALEGAAWALVLSLCLLAVAVLGERLSLGWLHFGAALPVALPLVTAAWLAARKIPLMLAARALDQSHGLADRVQSALEFEREPAATPFMQAAVRDALAHRGKLSASRAAPFHRPRATRYGIPAAASLALSWFVPLPQGGEPAPVLSPAEHAAVPALDPDTHDAFAHELESLKEQAELSEESARIAREYEQVLNQLARGDMTREEALSALAELQRQLDAARAAERDALNASLRRLASALSKHQLTSQLAANLNKGELERAASDLEELAALLKRRPHGREERERLARALERAADENERADKAQAQSEREPSLLKKKREDPKAQSAEPSLLKKKREAKRKLDQLRRDRAAQREARRKLEQLRRNLGQAANKPNGQAADNLRQAAESLRNLAQQGLSEQQQRKLAQQLSQLRQQLQRQGGAAGPNGQQSGQQSGQQKRLERFRLQAQGQNPDEANQMPIVMRKPSSKKPGDGKPQPQPTGGESNRGQGDAGARGKKGGKGQGQKALELGGSGEANAQLELPGLTTADESSAGSDGSDDRPMDPNQRLAGKLQDSHVQGAASRGPSRSQVILGASEQGFATTPYTKVYTDYRSHAEEVLERDRVPPGYRFYVRRYFQLIRPRNPKEPP